VNGKAIKCNWLSIDNEDGAVRVDPAANVRVRRLVDGRWFLQRVTATIALINKRQSVATNLQMPLYRVQNVDLLH